MNQLLAALINRLLTRQPEAAAPLAQHAGKRLRIALPLARLDFAIDSDGYLRAADTAQAIDCEVALPPDVLLALPLLGEPALNGVHVRGDGVLAADLSSVFRQLDWAVALAPYLGPIVAARADAALKGFARWYGEARATVAQNVAEYLVYEAQLIAPGDAVREFVREVDALREAADRLSARIALLEDQAKQP